MQAKIDKVSMQIDRLAEVSLGRDCEKLTKAVMKFDTQLAEDFDWKERLRCYIPEKCTIKDASKKDDRTVVAQD